MRILLDNNLDWRLGRELAGHDVNHVLDLGWAELKNGELVRRAAAQFDVDLPQRRLTVFAEDRSLPVLDLLPYLRHCEASPYVPNNYQWNEVGKTAAAEAIGGWLESRYRGQISATSQLTSQR